MPGSQGTPDSIPDCPWLPADLGPSGAGAGPRGELDTPLCIGLFDTEFQVGSVRIDQEGLQQAVDALRERVDDTAKYVGTKIDVADVVKRISGMLTMEVFEPFVRKLTDEQLFAQLRSDAGGELLFLSNAFCYATNPLRCSCFSWQILTSFG